MAQSANMDASELARDIAAGLASATTATERAALVPAELVEAIQQLKTQRDAVILAHYYVAPEVQAVADYVGDSFYLAMLAMSLPQQSFVLCGVVFALFPANLAFARVVPEAEPYRSIFTLMFAVDQPHNLLPSLHIVYTLATGCALVSTQWARGRPWLCLVLALWAVAIAASTMLVHQHHVLDVVAAAALVTLLSWLIRPPRTV